MVKLSMDLNDEIQWEASNFAKCFKRISSVKLEYIEKKNFL